MNNKHVGSNFDDFLKEERILEETEALAKDKIKKMRNKHLADLAELSQEYGLYDS